MSHSGSVTSGYYTATMQYQICSTEFPFDPPTQSVTCNSCNTGKSALPDMYARCPRADTSGNARVPVLQLICDTSGKAAVFIC